MPDNRLQIRGFLVWSICALFFLFEFFLRTVIGTYQYSIMQDLHLSKLQFSLISSTIFLLIYGLMQLPVGLIVDNIGLKKSMLIGVICCSFACLGFASAHSFTTAIGYRMLMGLGASFGFICLLMSVHDWMPHKYSAIFIGLSQFIGTIGPMLASGPLENFSEIANVSWRLIFLILSGIGAFLTVLVFLFVKNNRQKTGKYTILYRPVSIVSAILRLFARIQPWLIAIVTACLYFAVEYLSENEGRAFLRLKGISSASAGYMLTIAWIGYATGCPFLGFLSDIFARRKFILKSCSALALLAILIIIYSTNKLSLQVAFFALGVSASGQSVGFATMAEQFKKQFVAVGFGLNNAIITTFSAIMAPVIGLMLDSKIKENNYLSLMDYTSVLNILFLIALTGAILAVFFIKETYCKSLASFTLLDPKQR